MFPFTPQKELLIVVVSNKARGKKEEPTYTRNTPTSRKHHQRTT